MDGNNVEYTYHPGGRIESITDGTGHRKLGYDALGNLVFNRHTYVQPHSPNTLTLTTQWHYDSWGRMLQMTYSDGESVHYEYNRAGDLLRMYGEKNNHSRKYIDNIGYNKYGQRTRIDYGNGSYTEYAYDPLRRLTSLHSVDGTVSHRTMQLNEYTFDKLNNIVQVHNAASDIGGLGGVYTNTYSYDELNRLVEAHGTGTAGRQLCEFQMGGMRYSASGRLGLKHQNWNSATTGGTQRLEYGYPGNAPDDKPHAPRLVEDIDAGRIYGLEWDPAGNLIQVSVQGDDPAFQSRFLYWTEDNRLHTVADDYSYSYYAYGHTGQRTLKMAGNASLIDQNAWHQSVFVGLDRVTMYPSAYLVLSEHGYTKHYYAGAERVAARIGGGNLNHDTECIVEDGEVIERSNNLFRQCSDIVNNYTVEHRDLEEMNIVNIDNDEMEAMWKFDMKQVPSMMKAEVIPEPWKILDAIEHFSQPNSIVSQGDDDEPDVYFYHSDHLGSASWITDSAGTPIQHLQYLPYGEPFVNQRAAGYSERFTFTGKERDEETGYGYFGARYMDHELMTMWLSVDPMSDKYPSISPYAYCAWNPVKLVDPDGQDWYDLYDDGTLVRNEEKSKEYQNSDVIWSVSNKTLSDKFSLGTLSEQRRDEKNGETGSYINLTGSRKENVSVFKFCSDNSNVEFSLMEIALIGDETFTRLTTSHNERRVGVPSTDNYGSEYAKSEFFNLISHLHNHAGQASPSGDDESGDISFRNKINELRQVSGQATPVLWGIYKCKGKKKYTKDYDGNIIDPVTMRPF